MQLDSMVSNVLRPECYLNLNRKQQKLKLRFDGLWKVLWFLCGERNKPVAQRLSKAF